jgi:glutamyl-tRNA synthetase
VQRRRPPGRPRETGRHQRRLHLRRLTAWATEHDPELAHILAGNQAIALRALDIERDGTDTPRKDLRNWSGFRPVYGYFFPQLFTPVTDPGDQRFSGLDPTLVLDLAAGFAASYQPPTPDADWFAQIRDLAARQGFAPTQKAYKKDPGAYPGSIRDASQAIRVLLTGTTRSPDIAAVADVLGTSEVLRRATALAD